MLLSLTIPNNHRVKALYQPWQDEVGGREIAEVAALADRLGFARLTVGEHFLVPGDQVAVSGAHFLSAATTLAYLAGRTERIRVASNTSTIALLNPVVSAKQWAVLDWLSGGRADLVVGVGWLEGEFDQLGVDFRTRGRRLDECVEAIRLIWSRELASYTGEFVSFHEIASQPKPVQAGGVPLWFAGDVAQTFKRVARWGAGWSPYRTPPGKIPEGIDRIRAHPDYHGQEVGVFFNLANLHFRDHHLARAGDDGFDVWNAQQLVDQIAWLGSLGVTEVTPPLPRLDGYQHYLDRLRWLAEEVMPQVR